MNNINAIPAIQNVNGQRLAYAAPQAIEVADSTELVQGGGGMSGLDYAYYYYFDGNGQ